ncbi:glycosyltransferase family 4 protein [Gluconobacter morbifer]|uniref:Lipopolysaccharide glycosyl transferase n=1 Tax=Gluconobacter morbifer G707 TaxID=1088869 RepID=G6XGZ1_9PROT|nr:glycosyltransferase family 4 protein [Gluconobacter morbifer]EHH69449.1 lipopolysaccharide glycosyl transferase [Gluconobacter morbifer G707]
MKVAYVINSVECGGAQMPIPDIVALLRARGGDVTVFGLAPKDALAVPLLENAGVPVRVRSGTLKDHVAAYRWLSRELQAFQPDLIWTSLTRASLLGQLVANRLNVPTVHWQHSARLKGANAFLLRLCRKRTTLWIADSRTVENFARRTLGLKNNLLCWPIFRANPDTPLASPWKQGQTVRIGTVGRLHAVKGYDFLCEAIRLLKDRPGLPPFRLLIAGDGPEQASLAQCIRNSDLPVELLGHYTAPLDFMKTLHLYVQPSHWEGLCVAAHEAMSCGLPIVATPAGELAVTIEEGRTGKIVPFNNAPALASAIGDLLQRPEKLAEMGRLSRERVLERFGPKAFAEHGNAVLDRLPGFTPRRPASGAD